MVRMGIWSGFIYSRYFFITFYGFMDFFQEVSFSVAFGVSDGRGVRGFCDEQVGAVFVNLGGFRIEVGGVVRLGVVNWILVLYIVMVFCIGSVVKCYGQYLRDKRLFYWGGYMGDIDMLIICLGFQYTFEGFCIFVGF